MFKAGVSAYVLKKAAGADLVQAIQAVLRGDRSMSSTAGANDATVARHSADLDRSALSEREVEFLRQVTQAQRSNRDG